MAIFVVIMGAGGRMGQMLIRAVIKNPKTTLVGAFVRQKSALLGVDAGEVVGIQKVGVPLSVIGESTVACDVLIDFSLPEALEEVLDFCTKTGAALVMGVTGLSKEQESKLRYTSKKIPIVYAGNYSTGVNLSLGLLATAARVLGLEADVEIIETHHKHKLDAPSGTALMMARAITQARDQNDDAMVYGRAGAAKRQTGDIGIHAVRGGEVVGEHTVCFMMDSEIIQITHKAQNRSTFAEGAVRAAIWLIAQKSGLFTMTDVLGLSVE